MGVVVKTIKQGDSDAYNHLVIYGVPKYSGDGKFAKEYTDKVNPK